MLGRAVPVVEAVAKVPVGGVEDAQEGMGELVNGRIRE